jgi:membrane-associated phospholipid phosphatase
MSKKITLANILSYVFSPTVFAFYVILIFLLFPPLKTTNILFNLIISIFFLCVFPIIAILYFKKKGTVDIWVSNQKQRTPFYIIAIMSYAIASVLFYLLNETTLYVLSMAYIGVTLAVTLGNFSTKISSHSAGVAGPLTAVSMVYGLIALPIFLIILPLVFWSRLKINAHTLTQLVLGTIIGIIVTFFVYYTLFPLSPSLL